MDQVNQLLTEFDWLFKRWGKNFPNGLNKRTTFNDDIAQEARLAFVNGFIQHCALGHKNCCSTTEVIDGKEFRGVSCEKSLAIALANAKYRAMDAARKFYRPGKKETVFADIEAEVGTNYDGVDVVAYLQGTGRNAIDVANAVGIYTPWEDTTVEQLEEFVDAARAVRSRAQMIKAEQLSGMPSRIGRALTLTSGHEFDLICRSGSGQTYEDISAALQIPLGTVKYQFHNLRNKLSRLGI